MRIHPRWFDLEWFRRKAQERVPEPTFSADVEPWTLTLESAVSEAMNDGSGGWHYDESRGCWVRRPYSA